MRLGARAIFEDIVGAIIVAATVLGYTATHEHWNVWLIGDSRRWTAGLLSLLAIAMFALATRHVSSALLVVLLVAGVVCAVFAFLWATLTPLLLLAVTIVLVWAIVVVRDLFVVSHKPVAT